MQSRAIILVSLERSEKVMHEYVIFIHVYACFLCLNLKLVTLPEEKRTQNAPFKSVSASATICAPFEIVSDTITPPFLFVTVTV